MSSNQSDLITANTHNISHSLEDRSFKDIEEQEKRPDHNNFVKFMVIFTQGGTNLWEISQPHLNYVCSLINRLSSFPELATIWEQKQLNGKTIFYNRSMQLKLPNNPIFHLFKTFLDMIQEFEATDAELTR